MMESVALFPAIDYLGKNLRRYRLIRKLTQAKLAALAEMDVKHYQKIELGMWRDVRLATIERLADCLGVCAWHLIRTPDTRVVQPDESDTA
jgi:transcriptional regulator with XRE-family HTH domain